MKQQTNLRDILVTNGYGARTNQPFVTITNESQEYAIQLSPEDTVNLAHNLLEAAEASLQDGFLIEWLRQLPGVTGDYEILGMLEDFRHWREERNYRHEQRN